MSETLYVATGGLGEEHGPEGPVRWELPGDGPSETTSGDGLVLRRPSALLDVLDERIFRARSDEAGSIDSDGTVRVNSAELVSETGWNAEVAARFALQCAEHLVGQVGNRTLPNGKSLSEILTDARNVLDGVSADAAHELGYLARVRALRRLKHERSDLGDLSLNTLVDDEAKDVDALDDPTYASIAPVTDAVLAAIEALRHHAVPRFLGEIEESHDEEQEHRILDRKGALHQSTIEETPWGPIASGVPHVRHEPAWSSAREAARHARIAIKDHGGEQAEEAELHWQAEALERALEP